MFVKFEELTKKQQKEVFAQIVQSYKDNGETETNATECAKDYIIDKEFKLVDYSFDEDGTDMRVEW